MSRPAQIRFLSRAAPLYDPWVHAMGFPRLWQRLAEREAPGPGAPCLDVCTGTGGLALALARRGGRVIGLDLAAGMLERARRKARAARLEERTCWVRMDARRLAFPSACFPLVTCAMSLHEMSEQERAAVLRELRRVSSDRVLIADYRVPSQPWRGLVFRLLHAFEYLEGDDFGGFLAQDLRGGLERAGFGVERPWDVGTFRVWPCRTKAG